MIKIQTYMVIDEFTYKQNDHIYFLTHWHAGKSFIIKIIMGD